jgi:hypothetical protein
MNQSTKLIQKMKQRDLERQLGYRKVGRALTKWRAIYLFYRKFIWILKNCLKEQHLVLATSKKFISIAIFNRQINTISRQNFKNQ